MWEPGPRLVTNSLNILNINVDGARKRCKRLALLEILAEHHIDVCVITESHLRKREIKRIKFNGYAILGKHCRQNPGRITGGVLILVKNAVAAKETKSPFGPKSNIEACSVILYPTDKQETVMRPTGVYISPKRTSRLTLDKLAKLSRLGAPEKQSEAQQHLLAGDFNTTSWTHLFHEWTQEEGLWELVRPEQPTNATGGRIDKCIYAPGPYIPSTF